MDGGTDLEVELIGRYAGNVGCSSGIGKELGCDGCCTDVSAGFWRIQSGVCVDAAGKVLQQCSVVNVRQRVCGADDS